MKQLVNYIIEKLHIGKDIKSEDIWDILGITESEFINMFLDAINTTAEFRQNVNGYRFEEDALTENKDGSIEIKIFLFSSHQYNVDNIPFECFSRKLESLLNDKYDGKDNITIERYYEDNKNYIIIKLHDR